MEGRSAQRLAAMVAMQQQSNDALRSAQAVVDQHTQWILSHLSAADRELIESVTGETIAPGADSASVFALTLAESRVSKAQASAASASHMMMCRPSHWHSTTASPPLPRCAPCWEPTRWGVPWTQRPKASISTRPGWGSGEIQV